MGRERFFYKINGSFCFNTEDKDNSIVTQKLGMKSTWSWNKGDKQFIKKINEIRYRPYGIWGYAAKPIFTHTTDVSPMIQYFRKLLSDKIEIINELINEYKFECSIRITIYTEEDGACGTTLSKEDLEYLSKICSYFDISYLQVGNVENSA
jgi:hypothetical protein